MTTSTRFIQLANEALASGKLSESSAIGLRNLLDIRLNRHASREINLFEEVRVALEEPKRSLPVIPESQISLFNILYSIYSILNPDSSESNLRAATFDAIDDIQPSQDDLKEIFNTDTKIKYYSLAHLHHLLIYRNNLDLAVPSEALTNPLEYCISILGKPYSTAKRWSNCDNLSVSLVAHIYYHLLKANSQAEH